MATGIFSLVGVERDCDDTHAGSILYPIVFAGVACAEVREPIQPNFCLCMVMPSLHPGMPCVVHGGVKGNINKPMLSVVILLLVLRTTVSVDRSGIVSSPYRIILTMITFPRASIDTLLVYQ
jgi:hypothetical protein